VGGVTDLRLYVPGVDAFDRKGYPLAWQTIKHAVREAAGHRCVRCLHPYRSTRDEKGPGEWSPCDERCQHGSEGVRWRNRMGEWTTVPLNLDADTAQEARWRILTVHHLTGVKADCRWWNLAALCQRCHLTVQGRVLMPRVYPWEHSAWFKPYAAGWYAWTYLGLELSREETEERIDELLGLERVA
jgi:hypothetical protein